MHNLKHMTEYQRLWNAQQPKVYGVVIAAVAGKYATIMFQNGILHTYRFDKGETFAVSKLS